MVRLEEQHDPTTRSTSFCCCCLLVVFSLSGSFRLLSAKLAVRLPGFFCGKDPPPVERPGAAATWSFSGRKWLEVNGSSPHVTKIWIKSIMLFYVILWDLYTVRIQSTGYNHLIFDCHAIHWRAYRCILYCFCSSSPTPNHIEEMFWTTAYKFYKCIKNRGIRENHLPHKQLPVLSQTT